MRREQDVIERQQRVIGKGRLRAEDVDHRAGDRPPLQTLPQRRGVDQLGPRRIDEDTVRPQQRQLARPDHAPRLGGQARRQHHDLRLQQQIVQRGRLGARGADHVRLDVGVVHQQPQPEATRDRREGATDTAETDQTADASRQLGPCQIVAVEIEPPATLRNPGRPGGDTARQRQHRPHDVLGHRLRIATGAEEDGNPARVDALADSG